MNITDAASIVYSGPNSWLYGVITKMERQIATLDALDLYDIGAEARQKLRGVGEGLHLLEGEDAHAVKGLAVLDGIGIGDCSEFHAPTLPGEPSGSSGRGPILGHDGRKFCWRCAVHDHAIATQRKLIAYCRDAASGGPNRG